MATGIQIISMITAFVGIILIASANQRVNDRREGSLVDYILTLGGGLVTVISAGVYLYAGVTVGSLIWIMWTFLVGMSMVAIVVVIKKIRRYDQAAALIAHNDQHGL